MAAFTRQSGAWQPLKGMQIHNGVSFVNPKQGWVYDAGAWRVFYPEIPQNTSLPTISGTAAYQYTLTAAVGGWNLNGAYAPTSYSYQWLREGVAISGATASTRICDANDIGKNISVRVTATNARGSVSATSATVFVVPVMTTITLTNATLTPGTPTITSSTAVGVRGWEVKWTAGTNRSSTSVSADSGTVTYTDPNTTATGTAGSTATTVNVTVTETNTSYRLTASWSSIIGATSYKARLDNGTFSDIGNVTSVTYSVSDTNTHTVTVIPVVSSTDGISGTSSAVASASKSASASTGNFSLLYPPSDPTVSYTPNKPYFYVDATFWARSGSSAGTASGSGSTGNPTPTYNYQWRYRTTPTGTWTDITNATSTTYTLPVGLGSSGYEYTVAVRAKNTIGTTDYFSNWVQSTTTSGPVVTESSSSMSISNVTGVSAANDILPAGGTFYWSNPGPIGVGSGFWNYLNIPTDLWDIDVYKSSTLNGTYTKLRNTSVSNTGPNQSPKLTQTTSLPGYFYANIRGFNALSSRYGAFTATPKWFFS